LIFIFLFSISRIATERIPNYMTDQNNNPARENEQKENRNHNGQGRRNNHRRPHKNNRPRTENPDHSDIRTVENPFGFAPGTEDKAESRPAPAEKQQDEGGQAREKNSGQNRNKNHRQNQNRNKNDRNDRGDKNERKERENRNQNGANRQGRPQRSFEKKLYSRSRSMLILTRTLVLYRNGGISHE
jgi:transcription termination factor Rho